MAAYSDDSGILASVCVHHNTVSCNARIPPLAITSAGCYNIQFEWICRGIVRLGPLLFAVFYGLMCACIDHNVKKLEPYFQLSKPRPGVSAEDSPLLGYPYVLSYVALIKALLRGE